MYLVMMVIDPANIGIQRVLIDGKEIERVNSSNIWGSGVASMEQMEQLLPPDIQGQLM